MTHPSQVQLAQVVAVLSRDAALSTREAERHGITRDRMARAASAGIVQRIARGHYRTGKDPLDAARHHIARLGERGIPALLGGLSAAPFWGVPAFGSTGPVSSHVPLTLLVPRGSNVRQGTRHGIRIMVADLRPADVTQLDDVPITSPLRTGLDVARDLGRCRVSALIPLCGGVRAQAARLMGARGGASAHDITERLMIDSELRVAVLTELHEAIAHVNPRGMLWVRRVAADVEPLLETALEGLAWAVLTASNLPRAEPQRVIAGSSGKRYRVDFLIAGRVILEADGAVKYGIVTPWQEKQRQSDLEAAGYWVVRCTWEELIHRPHEVLARILVALTRSAPI
jgi:very-short-patch-repair endonuclease